MLLGTGTLTLFPAASVTSTVSSGMIRTALPAGLRTSLTKCRPCSAGFLAAKWMDQEKRIEAYKDYKVSEMRAHDLVIKALDCRALTVTQIPAVLSEYRNPRHEEFRPRTALASSCLADR
jgi:hypothetical protein